MKTDLDILYEDEQLVAIHKPNGLLVHRTKIAGDATEFALQLLRDQIGQKVFPTHRLDRKTSGVLLFAKDDETNRLMQIQFMDQKVEKGYLAIVRGWINDEGTVDVPLTNDAGKTQDAVTNYRMLMRSEIDLAYGKFETSRYSLAEVRPTTGRMHQIRKHFAHLRHPIIGDRPHGCNKQNKLFKDEFAMTTMLLHAEKVSFNHPITNASVRILAPIKDEFKRMLVELKL
ncbi:MAG: tRNA pseudouridine65 synthase [Flavobacteriaceae bacterium]